MKDKKSTRLRLTHRGKNYNIAVDSTRYTDMLIVNQLRIGPARYWLILQNGTWRFIGDMPLYKEIKEGIVRKIADWHELPAGSEATVVVTKQESLRSGILLNALLCVMAAKKQMP